MCIKLIYLLFYHYSHEDNVFCIYDFPYVVDFPLVVFIKQNNKCWVVGCNHFSKMSVREW